jgi:hypothetical protein
MYVYMFIYKFIILWEVPDEKIYVKKSGSLLRRSVNIVPGKTLNCPIIISA